MTYRLKFLKQALKEWEKLDATIRVQFKHKLSERLTHPKVHADQLHGMKDTYKIKLRDSGYRLVYRVIDKEICIIVIGVGRREGGQIYLKIRKRAID